MQKLLILFIVTSTLPASAGPLEDARSSYHARVAAIEKNHAVKVTTLKERYTTALDQLQKLYTGKGELQHVVAVRSERDRFNQAGVLSAEQLASEPQKLGEAQKTFLRLSGQLGKQLEQDLAKVARSYVLHLQKLKVELTKLSRIDDALSVDAEIKAIKETVNLSLAEAPPKETTTPPPPPASQIPQDAVSWERHHYRIFREPRLTWDAAKKRCEEMGGYLCIINTRAENDFLTELGAGKGIYYCGATDRAKEGDWRWVDGSRVRYKNWAKGQPNDHQSGEDYFATYPGYWPKWNDFTGDGSKVDGFICEWN